MTETKNWQPTNGEGGVPPLGFEQEKKSLLEKPKNKRWPLMLVVGLGILVGGLVVGYFGFYKPGRIAKIGTPDCGSLVPQDCETVPGCKLETKEVELSNNKCNSLVPQDCETVPGCSLKTKTTTITKQCTLDDCNNNKPGCTKEVVEVGGECICDPTSEASNRVLTTRSACEKYESEGCFWVPKNITKCSGEYQVKLVNAYCVGSGKKYVNQYCVNDPNYRPPQQKKESVTNQNQTTKNNNNSSNSCNQGVNHGCGAAPTNIPRYNKTAKLGPFEKDGKLVLFFYPLDANGGSNGVLKVVVEYEGKNHEIKLKPGKQRIVTDIQVKAGTTATLVKTIEHDQQDSCAPKQPVPPQGIGWLPPNNNGTCGTALPGPPQGGKCEPFTTPSIKEAVRWAESFGDPILSKECWADWMEWPGDYDFNDYFIMFALKPVGVSCERLSKDKDKVTVGDVVKFTCSAVQASGADNLVYEFRYKIDQGEFKKITQVKGNTASLKVERTGLYQVECRACLPGGSVCSSQWLPSTVK